MLYRQELCDLDNPEEGEICLKIAGLSLVPGLTTAHKVIISDETQEGRNEIIRLLKSGYRVLSIKD